MAKLRIKLFGPPDFKVNGASIRIGRRKVVALAAYLVVTGKTHSRDRLADLFWPEYDRNRARGSLRRTLSVMTKALGKFWVSVDRESIGFVPHEEIWVDVVRFRELAGRSGAAPAAALEEAAALHETPFLSGFTLGNAPDFDDWQFEQAEAMGREAARVLERLAELYMGRGDHGRAIPHALARVELDPLNETAHRQVIEMYRQAGRPDLALRQFEKCKARLRRELGVPPEKATSELAAGIGKQRLSAEQGFTVPLTNLPARSTPFVGRKQEIRTLVCRMNDTGVRLLNLTGPGGIGKTRLALEAAANLEALFPQGVFFLSLVDLFSVEDTVSALMGIFGLMAGDRNGPLSRLLEFIRQRRLLLVLDNLEHLPESGVLISKMLSRSPGLKILATSRTRLMLTGEHLFPLSGLSRPAAPSSNTAAAAKIDDYYDAPELFLSTARMVRPDMELNAADIRGILRICELTRGMPLALILAAGWMEILPPEKIADGIRKSLDFLQTEIRDLPPSHRSMRAVFDSSWNLLSEKEKEFFMTLSVFMDRFTMDAAAEVTGTPGETANALGASLARKSMLKSDPETGRFEIHPLLRRYLMEKSAAGGAGERLRNAHGKYYLNRMVEDGDGLIGEGMLTCRRRMDADFANIRKAWSWAVEKRDVGELTRAASALYVYFDMHTRYHEGEALFRPAMELLMGDLIDEMEPEAGVILLCWFDMQAQGPSAVDRTVSSGKKFREISEIARALLETAVKRGDRRSSAAAYLLMGAVAQEQKLYLDAVRCFRSSLEEDNGLEPHFWVTIRIGLCRRALGQMDRALKRFRESHGIGCGLGDAIKQAWSLGNIGSAELCLGNLETAESCLRSAEASFRRINAPLGIVMSLEELGLIAFLKGDPALAVSLADQSLTLLTELGFAPTRHQRSRSLKGLALVSADKPDKGRACLEKVIESGKPCFTAHLGMTFIACATGERYKAKHHFESAVKSASSVHKPQLRMLLMPAVAAMSIQAKRDAAACTLLSRVFHHPNRPAGLLRVWELPGNLVEILKSRMPEGQFEVLWNRGKEEVSLNEIIATNELDHIMGHSTR